MDTYEGWVNGSGYMYIKIIIIYLSKIFFNNINPQIFIVKYLVYNYEYTYTCNYYRSLVYS